ncbi:formylglycine-generating enzyme family protein [Dermatobacter hominis]|nr:formylglycine-generating enzyme family protein [Dermatobacter hominis]UDY37417.1 formylglycine-generating enzyme family protein [Dermatobacter hominis]
MSAAPTTNAGGMVTIPAGTVHMGSDRFYPEERPRRSVDVAAFRIDVGPVTNDRFAEFVADTGWVTLAERPLDPADYPGADPDLLHPGGVVFQQPPGPVPLDDPSRWWAYVPGASWRAPHGPGSDLVGRGDHPVVQVAFEDAAAYAAWRGARLPSEAEWERAARGGLDDAEYSWGDEPYPGDRQMANTWQGRFPWEQLELDGHAGTSPVGSFPANGYGLVDMAGNVWEWTTDWWVDHPVGPDEGDHACCGSGAIDSAAPGERYGRRVIKGGSHLCAPNYCHRFRPAARQPEAIDTSTCHVGFRCVAEV